MYYTDERSDGRLSIVHRFERLKTGADVTSSVLELTDVSDASAGRRRKDLTDAVRQQDAVWQSTCQIAEKVPELRIAACDHVDILTL